MRCSAGTRSILFLHVSKFALRTSCEIDFTSPRVFQFIWPHCQSTNY